MNQQVARVGEDQGCSTDVGSCLQVGWSRYDWYCVHWIWQDTGIFIASLDASFGSGDKVTISKRRGTYWYDYMSIGK